MADDTHQLSSLDEAHAYRLAGEDARALRLGITCAKASSGAPGPTALLTRMLVDADRSMLAPEVVPRLVDAFVRRGDLPQALVAAQIAVDAGADSDAHLAMIAEAFGKGSVRVGDGAPAPPPFPAAPPVAPVLEAMDLEALYGQADRVLNEYMASGDSVPLDNTLPELPLFGALEPVALEQLLRATRVDEVSGGAEVVRQGDSGTEAFVVARGLLSVRRREGVDEIVLAELGPGAVFGEMALVSAAPRTASVVALEPAQVLVLAREELERIAPEAPSLGECLARFCRSRMEANLVRHARVLQGISAAQRARALACFGSSFFEPGERLLSRGEMGDRIFLIASGSVSVSVPDESERLVLATLGPGDVAGEVAAILRRPASADVDAVYPTVTFDLSQSALREIMREHPALLVELYDLATRQEEEVTGVQEIGLDMHEVDDMILV